MRGYLEREKDTDLRGRSKEKPIQEEGGPT